MADAAERAKQLADEKAIRDKWYRENPRPVKQESQPKPQPTQPVNMTGLTTPPVDKKFVDANSPNNSRAFLSYALAASSGVS